MEPAAALLLNLALRLRALRAELHMRHLARAEVERLLAEALRLALLPPGDYEDALRKLEA